MSDLPERVRHVDSHTGGEPTRVLLDLDVGSGSMADRLRRLCGPLDAVRSAACNEPRASEIVVGAVLTAPHEPGCEAGVLFFNNAGPLGMCGHGTIGVVETLRHLGRVRPGATLRLDTPVGVIAADLLADGRVRFENVSSRRTRTGVTVETAGGAVTGDVAYGGNWFFVAAEDGPVDAANVPRLSAKAKSVMAALAEAGVTGDGGERIDHVELVAPTGPRSARGFVLCPGGAWDRSPCGTGTSAKLACLAADGKLAEGKTWTQESAIGSRFEGSYRFDGDRVVPTITGRAHLTGEGTLLFPPGDRLRFGWQSGSESEA